MTSGSGTWRAPAPGNQAPANPPPAAAAERPNVLFIVGGAFAGLEKLVESRNGKQGLGFGSELHTPKDLAESIVDVMPEDLMKFGLIPEFIGRLPVIATVQDLGVRELVRVMTEPKNALVKQYKRLFEMENVGLTFTEDALMAVAKKAITRKTGARGLRSILEGILLDAMFDLPSMDGVDEVVIDKDVIAGNKEPVRVYAKKEKEKAGDAA